MTAAEKKVFWLITVLLLVITSIPYIIGFSISDSGKSFAGYIENPRDTLSYYMWMRQVYEGETLLQNMFAPEYQTRIYFNPFFYVAGLSARICAVPPHIMYWIVRVPVALFLLYIIYTRFLVLFFQETWHRIWCYIIICFSSGLGWLFIIPRVLRGDLTPIHFPVDLYSPSAITFWTVLASPHIAFSQALLVLYFMYLMKFQGSYKKRRVLMAGLISGFTAVNHTYDIIIMGAVTLVYFLVLLAGTDRSRAVSITAASGIVLLFTLAGMAYVYVSIHANQTLKFWSEQKFSPDIHPASYLLGAGFLLPLAAAGIYRAIRNRQKSLYIPVIWLCVLPFLLYGFFFQPAKLVNGAHIPLCVLAIYGLSSWSVIRNMHERKRYLYLCLLLLLTVPSNMVVYGNNVYRHLLHPRPLPSLDRFYFPEHQMWAGFQWLDAHTDNDEIIMCSRVAGWMIPGLSGNKSLWGHRDFTMNLRDKNLDYHVYYLNTNGETRHSIIQKYNIDYVWVGPDELLMLKSPFQPDSSLVLVFQQDNVKIYRVVSGPLAR